MPRKEKLITLKHCKRKLKRNKQLRIRNKPILMMQKQSLRRPVSIKRKLLRPVVIKKKLLR